MKKEAWLGKTQFGRDTIQEKVMNLSSMGIIQLCGLKSLIPGK
jgi:hypothetical protein